MIDDIHSVANRSLVGFSIKQIGIGIKTGISHAVKPGITKGSLAHYPPKPLS
jgi:hypothetical protein